LLILPSEVKKHPLCDTCWDIRAAVPSEVMMAYDNAVFTDHAQGMLIRRRISAEQVRHVLRFPDADFLMRPGRRLVQGRILWGDPPAPYLLRVVMDADRDPIEVVTAYLTSKFAKYEA
jgi:hypothetical protein